MMPKRLVLEWVECGEVRLLAEVRPGRSLRCVGVGDGEGPPSIGERSAVDAVFEWGRLAHGPLPAGWRVHRRMGGEVLH